MNTVPPRPRPWKAERWAAVLVLPPHPPLLCHRTPTQGGAQRRPRGACSRDGVYLPFHSLTMSGFFF